MADLPPLPPRKTDQPRQLPSGPAGATARSQSKPGKPDPRPMRIVYGAGAVAVVSVIAVGLVQPDYTATADQQATSDPSAVAAANDPTAANDATNAPGAKPGKGRNNQSGTSGTQPNVQVNHVIKYIHLKPGQTAPPGATVIMPGQPTPPVVVANHPAPSATPPAHKPPANNPPPATKPPANNPPPVHQPPPPPTPRPTIKTHQSGRP